MSDWTIQATKILSRLDGHRSSRKMRDTIIGIVSAKTEGKTVVQYFATGNPVVSKQGFEKWMLDPTFKAVFDEVESLAYNTMDREALKSLRTARRALTHAAGIAVADWGGGAGRWRLRRRMWRWRWSGGTSQPAKHPSCSKAHRHD